ncbi:SDR family oxidoreductase [Streptomyces fulvoviolaceus]|uniref:SDR family oxidoreductase n=1 Tax=Streptomyces fulvoviolaceus TaxID=285535 RepID=UPI000693A78F|nr:SDR family oxidoreductase [Streptomyces fulvoviolaceus]
MTRPLSGRTALVTGGSRGIGAASAEALAGLGAHVVLTYRTGREAAERVAAACRERAGTAHVLSADLDGAAGADRMLDALEAAVDGVDVVVSNATTAHPRAALAQLETEQLLGKVDADLAVLHRLVRRLTPKMHSRGFGRYVVVSSGHAIGPSAPGMSAYGIGKAALEAMVRYLAAEEGHSGVTVNAVRPGFVRTDTSVGVPEAVRDRMRRAIPAGRLAAADDIAGVVSLLAQPAAGWVNGICLPATGGLNHPVDWPRIVRQEQPGGVS